MKANAYEYQRKINRELARIRRIQVLQARMVALTGTALASALIGISNFGARVAYMHAYGEDYD